MPDSSVGVITGTGAQVDTATQANGDHRQVMVLGDAVASTWARVNTDGSQLSSTVDGPKATYSTSVTGTAGVAGDTMVISGSATRTIRVTRVAISGTQTTSAEVTCTLQKRVTANAGGTSSVSAAASHDSADAAATATVLIYTVAPTTPGATNGPALRSTKLFVSSAAAATEDAIFTFGDRPGARAVVLRGTAQSLAVNLSAAVVGGSYNIDIEWTEE